MPAGSVRADSNVQEKTPLRALISNLVDLAAVGARASLENLLCERGTGRLILAVILEDVAHPAQLGAHEQAARSSQSPNSEETRSGAIP